MVAVSLEQQILDEIRRLDDERRRQVLNFARSLGEAEPLRGESGVELLQSRAALGPLDQEDLAEMAQAIEEGCEQINQDRNDVNLDGR